MKKLFLPLCLLGAGSVAAISNTFASLLAHEATREVFQKLSVAQQTSLDDYFTELEVLLFEANRDLDYLSVKHAEGFDLLKELFGADQLLAQVTFTPIAATNFAIDTTETSDYADLDKETPRFVS